MPRYASRWVFAMVMLAVSWNAMGQASPRRLEDLGAFEKRVQELYERVAGSAVTLFHGTAHKGSGVIVDPEGLVLTHGHHELSPGAAVTVVVGGKQKVAGTLLGVHEYYDQSLIRLEEKGPWPAVPLGRPSELEVGEAVLMLGFAKIYYREGRPPLARIGRVLGFLNREVITSCRLEGGDSGGPLFNLKGELLGTNQTSAVKGVHGAGHPSVECYRQIREALLAGKHVKRGAMEGPFEDPSALAGLAAPNHRSVVEVSAGEKVVGLGLIVDANGLIVTKGSEVVDGAVACRLSDGRRLEAKVVGRSKAHDLALLSVKGDGLAAAEWAGDGAVRAGSVVASVGAEARPLMIGVVCAGLIDVPRARGQLAINVEAAGEGVAGVRVSEVWRFRPAVAKAVRAGDVVTHINGEATGDPEAFVRVREKQLDDPAWAVGDSLRLTLAREGKSMEVNVPIESEASYQDEEFRGRHTGFAAVFTHDALLKRAQLGGPVVDSRGKVVGLNVGMVWGGFAYAIPSEVVRTAVEEMKRSER